MKNYVQAITRYFALMAEISELENLEYELVRTLLLKMVKNLEESVGQKSSSHDLVKQFDALRAVQKNAAQEQGAAIEKIMTALAEKASRAPEDDSEIRKPEARIPGLLARMDRQRETFRRAKDLFRKILRDLKRFDESN